MDVSISIVNYYSSALILKSIETIRDKTKGLSYEIIITNNSPDDYDIYNICEKFSDVNIRLIDLKQNVGFSKANNKAFESALGKYFLIYNPDLFLIENSILSCLDFLEKNNKYVCCTVKFTYPDGTFQASGFYKQKGARLFYNYIPGISKLINTSINQQEVIPSKNDDVVDIDVVCGAFLFVHRTTYSKIGGFDEDFFLYGEDWEISNRIGKAGKIALINNTQVVHMHGGTSEKEFDEDGKDFNLLSRKGTQMFVSILLWQKKEFGNLVALKLVLLLFLGLILNFLGVLRNLFKKSHMKDFGILLKNFFTIIGEFFYMIFNTHRVYKTM